MTRLRDAHTRYAGPEALGGSVAVLPFVVEMAGTVAEPSYVVTKVGRGLDPAFEPGVTIEFWNGVPIDLAIQRYSEREVGGRPDTQRAWATQSLTARPLRYGPPPDEYWVVIGYRPLAEPARAGDQVTGRSSTPTRSAVERRPVRRRDQAGASARTGCEPGRRGRPPVEDAAVRTPGTPGRQAQGLRRRERPAASLPRRRSSIPGWSNAQSDVDRGAGGPFGYLRIYAFDAEPDGFIDELVRMISLLPDRGLIIDIRGNPGGYIWAAELALQLFTPNEIKPTRFSVLATPFTRDMTGRKGPLGRAPAVEGLARRRRPQRRALRPTDPDHRP